MKVTPLCGPRVATGPDMCFYCKRPLGSDHADDCVIVTKKVQVRFTATLPVRVPASWSAEDIEFFLNESSHCLDTEAERFARIFMWLRKRRPSLCLTCRHIDAEVVDPHV